MERTFAPKKIEARKKSLAEPETLSRASRSTGGMQGATAGMPLFLQRSAMDGQAVEEEEPEEQEEVIQQAPLDLGMEEEEPNQNEDHEAEEEPSIQTKLAIGQPNDKYEQEADRVADQVMRMPEPKIQRLCPKCEEELQRQPMEEEEKKKEEEGTLQTTAQIGVLQRQVLPDIEEEEVIQTKTIDNQAAPSALTQESSEIPPTVHEVLRSPDQPLDLPTRAFMESRFGHDFSRVRVHTDARAAESAHAVNARAYTIGSDIVFGWSQYAPVTTAGRRLLAHELAHFIQQGAGLSGRPARMIQRFVGGDVTQMSITPAWTRDLTDRELEEQIRIVRAQTFGSAETEEVTRINLVILEAESSRRRREGAPRLEEHRETTQRGGYRDEAVAISYDRIVTEEAMSNPNPQSGFDQNEINRIACDPHLLEQVYYDAASGNPRARWLVQQYEGVAGALGQYIARRLNAWECLIINCTVNWEQIVFSPSTRSGRHLREILSGAFEREAQRIGLKRQIIANVLMLVAVGVTARGVLAREASLAGRGAPVAEGAAAETAAAEARSVAGGEQPIVIYRGTTYRYVEGRSQMVHDLGDGTYWTYEMSQGVRFAQIRRAQVQSIEPGAPGVVLRAEVPPSEFGRVLDFYNNPALRSEWEAFARGQPGGQYVLRGGPAEMYNAHFQNWLQSRGMRLQDFDVIVGPDYIHGGSQICIRNPSIASRVLSRAQEAARAHEPVTPSYPEIPE